MGERADQIEEQIHRTREDLRYNLNELEEKVKSAFDWRMQFEEHPFTMLSIALGGGMLVAALIPRGGKRNGSNRSAASMRRNMRNAADEAPSMASEKAREANGSLDAWKDAFMTVAATRIGGFLGDLWARYRDEVRRAKRER
jgi:hypothetical protein